MDMKNSNLKALATAGAIILGSGDGEAEERLISASLPNVLFEQRRN
jgi:hypothetical protein